MGSIPLLLKWEIGEAWKHVSFGPSCWRPCCWLRWVPAFRAPITLSRLPTRNLPQQFAEAAEKDRHELAVEWLGQTMPNWSQPCLMTVEVGPHLGAGGATTFMFDRGEVFGWRMNIQGSAERILDSVLPHEVTHMVFATHFRRPLPRWADEGGATSMECPSEKAKHRAMLLQFLRTGRGIAFSQMFEMTEYPPDVMPLYAQGYSLAEYMIQHGGRRKYVQFLDDALANNQWSAAVQRHYGMTDLAALQNTWLAWVRDGFPAPRGHGDGRGGGRAEGDRRPTAGGRGPLRTWFTIWPARPSRCPPRPRRCRPMVGTPRARRFRRLASGRLLRRRGAIRRPSRPPGRRRWNRKRSRDWGVGDLDEIGRRKRHRPLPLPNSAFRIPNFPRFRPPPSAFL